MWNQATSATGLKLPVYQSIFGLSLSISRALRVCIRMWLIWNPGNELIFIINGTLEVEFEYPHIHRDGISPYINDYIDKTSLFGTAPVIAFLFKTHGR